MAGAGQKEDEPITNINVTPLVDVCLVLVIIFMAVAPMAVTFGIKVFETRPSTAEGKASVDENVNIKITEDGVIAVNGVKTDGVMYLLLADIACRLIDEHRYNYLMYDTYLGALPGLREFKRELGFAPYRIRYAIA